MQDRASYITCVAAGFPLEGLLCQWADPSVLVYFPYCHFCQSLAALTSSTQGWSLSSEILGWFCHPFSPYSLLLLWLWQKQLLKKQGCSGMLTTDSERWKRETLFSINCLLSYLHLQLILDEQIEIHISAISFISTYLVWNKRSWLGEQHLSPWDSFSVPQGKRYWYIDCMGRKRVKVFLSLGVFVCCFKTL